MMGERTVAQEAPFYSFNLERHVPADHLRRSIDRFVDLSDIREHLRPFYSSTGWRYRSKGRCEKNLGLHPTSVRTAPGSATIGS
jgi:hypothetical protein